MRRRSKPWLVIVPQPNERGDMPDAMVSEKPRFAAESAGSF